MNCNSSPSPKLAIPLGDPAGIGIEVILKSLHQPWTSCNFGLVGDRTLLQQTYTQLCQVLSPSERSQLANPEDLEVLEVPLSSNLRQQIQLGRGNAASGEASFRFLQAAIDQTLAGQFQGIVTAPIAKSAWQAAGHFYPGQTELLAERSSTERFGMLFVARSPHTGWVLRTLLATTHIPLAQVPQALTPELMTRKLSLLIDCLQQDFGIAQPRIAIAGLNPHSGEQGQLGREEQDWLIAWLAEMGDRFPQVQLQGPVPPDTLWVAPGQAWYGLGHHRFADQTKSIPSLQANQPNHPDGQDAYLALYHDQGLIPVKLMAFDRAVNTTIGLPFVRTSPDHGTAFDIAGKGIADASSFSAAIEFAIELVQQPQAEQRSQPTAYRSALL
ncbi:MAG: 4-hydroxythreonine-4-phosphate dehydrogenase PdxA [Elainella sp. Prado103]|jgi:4-hydroxythreonine-4-phosphate dehydrogenase|nr:4-hydroxythreonine-4-phosphate dehydrogenase PdxA [Elainella sp. Prado103]